MKPTTSQAFNQEPPCALLLGLPFHVMEAKEAVQRLVHIAQGSAPKYVVTANVDFVLRAHKNSALKHTLFHAAYVLCDGQPLVWLSRLLGAALPQRLAGADILPKLLQACCEKKLNVYFLGGTEATLPLIHHRLKKRYPQLNICGMHAPPFTPLEAWNSARICQSVQATKADVLVVSLSFPKQETWIARNYASTGAKLTIGTGAAVNFLTGLQKRAPLSWQRCGLEWLWRLLRNPLRLGPRYAAGAVFLPYYGFKQWLRQGRTAFLNRPNKTVQANDDKLRTLRLFKPRIHRKRVRYHFLVWEGYVERATLKALHQPNNFTCHVVCNCQNVQFIDSSGIGQLAHYARQCEKNGFKCYVYKPSAAVVRVLTDLHLTAAIPIIQNLKDIPPG